MWLNYDEIRYLLHLTAERYPGLIAHGPSLRREVKFAAFADWYYEIEFNDTTPEHTWAPRVRFASVPHTDNLAAAGAVWRACAAYLDEAAILQASLSRFRFDFRGAPSTAPRCSACTGTGKRMALQTTGTGKKRTSTDVEVECGNCKGGGVRLTPYYSGPAFDAFCAAHTREV